MRDSVQDPAGPRKSGRRGVSACARQDRFARVAGPSLLFLAVACGGATTGGGTSVDASTEASTGPDGDDIDATASSIDAEPDAPSDDALEDTSDETPDAPFDAPTINLAPCSPPCDPSTQMCVYPQKSGIDAGCDGPCPPSPPPTCQPLPSVCSPVTCGCVLLQTCHACTPGNGACGYNDGQWIVQCGGC